MGGVCYDRRLVGKSESRIVGKSGSPGSPQEETDRLKRLRTFGLSDFRTSLEKWLLLPVELRLEERLMNNTIAGEYFLQGVKEMASGFLLKPDNSFQFFFAYGALDRHATGKWEQNDGHIVMNSAARPGNDFVLTGSSRNTTGTIGIIMEHKSPLLRRHIYCSLEEGNAGSWKQMNEDGEVTFPQQDLSSIAILFEFCPERFTQIFIDKTDHNTFRFRPEPWLFELFLENFTLSVGNNQLSGGHPLMEGDGFRYEKA